LWNRFLGLFVKGSSALRICLSVQLCGNVLTHTYLISFKTKHLLCPVINYASILGVASYFRKLVRHVGMVVDRTVVSIVS
jgi:hypothetical protein